MKKFLSPYFVIISAMPIILSCSGPAARKQPAAVLTNDTSFLADKNFAYRNLRDTKKLAFFTKPLEKGIDLSAEYTDSTLKKQYYMLSGDQAAWLITPFLPKDYGAKYVKDEIAAWLIAKQKKIGELQPIVVFEMGKADFEALELIVLGKNGKPTDEFDLDQENDAPEGYNGNPHTTDGYSILNNNEIESYRITKNTDSAKRRVIIDSNVFKSIIGADGKISTKQVVKSRVIKPF